MSDLVERGILYFFGSSVIKKIVQFILSVIVVRILSKTVYASFAYANNILSFIMLFSSMGMRSGLLQFASSAESEESKKNYLFTTLKYGFAVNFILFLITIIISIFIELPITGSNLYLAYLSGTILLVFIPGTIFTYWRSRLLNRRYGILNILLSIVSLILSIIGLLAYKVIGLIIAKYIALILFIIAIFLFFGRTSLNELKRTVNEKLEFFKFSFVSMLTNLASRILYLIDIFLIGLIIKDSAILAEYKIATVIPFALIIIPGSVMVFLYPYFAKHRKDNSWIREHYIKLLKRMFLINTIITLVLIIGAPFIIEILYGSEYAGSVLPFRILSIGYIISATFRIPSGNIINALRKVKMNFYNSIFSGVCNIILDIILILKIGSIGAAITTLFIIILSSTFSNIYLFYRLRENND